MVKGPAEKFERDISILRQAVGFDQFFFLLHNFFCNFWYYNIARVWILFLCLSFFPFCSTTENVSSFTKSALDSDTSWKCKIISIDEGGRLWDSHACLLVGDDEHMSTSNFQGIKACLYVSAIDSEWSQMRCRIFSFFFFFCHHRSLKFEMTSGKRWFFRLIRWCACGDRSDRYMISSSIRLYMPPRLLPRGSKAGLYI